MDQIFHFITLHIDKAPLLIFFLFLLAGMNIPISIDILVIISSLLAATIAKEKFYTLFFACLFGCYFSAWISYSIGKYGGKYLLNLKIGKKLFPEDRLKKIHLFYQKHGFLTLLIGRFIPFGIRNGIFMSTGMTQSSFFLFALRDIIPCLLWSSVTFTLFHFLGTSYEVLIKNLKILNIFVFAIFLLILGTLFAIKKRKAL